MRRNDDDRVRDALERAAEGVDDNVDELIGRLPAILAEAERRRQAEAGVLDSFVPLASRLVPRLAAATVVLMLIAFMVGGNDETDPEAPSMDELILGTASVDSQSDWLLRQIVGEERNDG